LVQIARRRHRESHVLHPALHLRLVVHDDGKPAAPQHRRRQRAGFAYVRIIGNDRDDVALLDGHAGAHHKVGVAPQRRCRYHHPPSLLLAQARGREPGQHVPGKPCHLAKLVGAWNRR
jgi:hypothetical protein